MDFIQQIRDAYADCADDLTGEPDEADAMSKRKLRFRSDRAVTRAKAIEIMSAAIPAGYNEFSAGLLAALPEDSMVTIAREGSVCIYVKGELPQELLMSLKADELDYDEQTDETRIWWDQTTG